MNVVTSASAMPDSNPAIDGRRARRDRNRETVVDALLDLYREGNLAPSISLVAKRSGVSHRSVFRYFEDLDELCRVAIERHSASVAHLVDVPDLGEGCLADRIESIIEARLELFQHIAPVARVTRMRAPLQPVLMVRLDAERCRLDEQTARHFAAEIECLPTGRRAAVAAAAAVACSFETLEALTHDRGLDRSHVAAVMRDLLTGLFGGLATES